MAKETGGQQRTIGRVMHEFKHGDLPQANGRKVRSRKQAIAIALSEAGASNRQTPAQNKRRLSAAKQRERTGRTATTKTGPTRAELYRQAQAKGISGRSRMTRDELLRALH